MELFPAADDETWAFIKSQIDDADYYVVVVAGRYGSTAPDGLSFTEKEYDYALERKKPAIGFVHGQPGKIAAERTEQNPELRAKLEAFLQKVKQRPVRSFTNPHELALEVTTSFVKLIRERPTEGYVRSSAAVEYKRYAELLEENNALKERLKAVEQSVATTIFSGYDKELEITILLDRQLEKQTESGHIKVKRSLGMIFIAVADAILENDAEWTVLESAPKRLVRPKPEGWEVTNFDDESVRLIRRNCHGAGILKCRVKR